MLELRIIGIFPLQRNQVTEYLCFSALNDFNEIRNFSLIFELHDYI